MSACLLSWWSEREPRERLLLAVLGALAGLFALVFLLVLPVMDARTDAERALDRARADLAAVSRLGPVADGGARAAFDRSALVAAARARDIRLTRVQPGNDGSLSVWIDEAQTRPLYGFLEDLLTGYDTTLDSVIVSSDANGRLSAQFVVR